MPDEWPVTSQVSATNDAFQEQASVKAVITSLPEQQWWTRLLACRRIVGVVQTMLFWKYSVPRIDLQEKAEHVLFCFPMIQASCFPQELADIQAGMQFQQNLCLRDVWPFLDNAGLIRAMWRLWMSAVDVDSKYLIILTLHYLLLLLLRFMHCSGLHQGVEGCVAALQCRFVIFSCWCLLCEIKRGYITCQRQNARPATKDMPSLPPDYVHLKLLFEVVGVDHAGPIYSAYSVYS